MISFVDFRTIPNEDIEEEPLLNVARSYEKSDLKPLKDIPLTITLNGRLYLLAAVIIFTPPLNVTGLGHYTTAVRFNDQFEIFDDLRANTHKIDNSTTVCIHSLLYVERKK